MDPGTRAPFGGVGATAGFIGAAGGVPGTGPAIAGGCSAAGTAGATPRGMGSMAGLSRGTFSMGCAGSGWIAGVSSGSRSSSSSSTVVASLSMTQNSGRCCAHAFANVSDKSAKFVERIRVLHSLNVGVDGLVGKS